MGLHANVARVAELIGRDPPLALVIYVLVYVGAVALSFPAASLLTVIGGFGFGWLVGGLAAAASATLGGTLAFLAARALSRDWPRRLAGFDLATPLSALRSDATAYMLFLRLTPLIPFWLVNIAAALADVPLATFLLTTLLGVLPAVRLRDRRRGARRRARRAGATLPKLRRRRHAELPRASEHGEFGGQAIADRARGAGRAGAGAGRHAARPTLGALLRAPRMDRAAGPGPPVSEVPRPDLCAIGAGAGGRLRRGLDAGWINHDKGGIIVDARMRTSNQRVFAIGDCVAGHDRFTHAASREAGVVTRNALLRLPARFDPLTLPRVTRTDLEVATVGRSETEAGERHMPYPTLGEASRLAALDFHAPMARRPLTRGAPRWPQALG